MLQLHILLGLKAMKGKQEDMIARGIVGLEHLDIDPLFPFASSDNTLKRHRGILEHHAYILNHLKAKETRHMCI